MADSSDDISPSTAASAVDASPGKKGKTLSPKEAEQLFKSLSFEEKAKRKIFVGGLSPVTTAATLFDHFSDYGSIIDLHMPTDKVLFRNRGFAFITFSEVSVVENLIDMKHSIDQYNVDVKRAISREDARSGAQNRQQTNPSAEVIGRIFVGGLSNDVNEDMLSEYFTKYGEISNVHVIMDRETNRSRGYGFVTFKNPDDAEQACGKHPSLGLHCEVKRAMPRNRNRNQDDDNNNNNNNNNWGQMNNRNDNMYMQNQYGNNGYGGNYDNNYNGNYNNNYNNNGNFNNNGNYNNNGRFNNNNYNNNGNFNNGNFNNGNYNGPNYNNNNQYEYNPEFNAGNDFNGPPPVNNSIVPTAAPNAMAPAPNNMNYNAEFMKYYSAFYSQFVSALHQKGPEANGPDRSKPNPMRTTPY